MAWLDPMAWLDRIAIAGIAALILLTPLAIGSVNPWSFCVAEIVIFLLTMVWMVRIALDENPRPPQGLLSLLIPAALFLSLAVFQLVPLPPGLMRVLSPSTYRLDATSLPGWPNRDPYPFPTGERRVPPSSNKGTAFGANGRALAIAQSRRKN